MTAEPDPPLTFITDPAHYDTGFLYVPGWDELHTHRDAKRGKPHAGRPAAMAWHKCLTDQLDNPAYRDLPAGARALLHDARMLVARGGNGRQSAAIDHLHGQLGYRQKTTRRNRDLIVAAGLLAICASRMPAESLALRQHRGEESSGAPTAHTLTSRKRARAVTAEGGTATNGRITIDGEPIAPDLLAAIVNGYRPGNLTDQQIDEIRAIATEEPL